MLRRTLLSRGAAAFAAFVWAPAAALAGPSAAAAPAWRSASAAAVGAVLREAALVETSPAALTAALTQTLGASPDAAARQTISAQIRRDFADGKIVVARGWALSLTEARLCALADALEART